MYLVLVFRLIFNWYFIIALKLFYHVIRKDIVEVACLYRRYNTIILIFIIYYCSTIIRVKGYYLRRIVPGTQNK